MTKPVEDMNAEEVAEALAEVRAERAKWEQEKERFLAAEKAPEVALAAVPEPIVEPEGYGKSEPAPWPHGTMEHDGMVVEYRVPSDSALIAISMTSMPGMDPQTQMQIFSMFMTKHLSPKSLVDMLARMSDPEDEFGIADVINLLTSTRNSSTE